MEKEVLWDKWKDPRFPEKIEDEQEYEEKINKDNVGPMLVGPMGIIPLSDHNLPSKNYNFWNLHTNFWIDEDVQKLIDNFPGTEVLDVFTPYRCRIAIGRLFDEDDYKEGLETALGVKK